MNVKFPYNRDLQNDNMHIGGSQENVSRMTKMASEYSLDISGRDKDISAFGMADLKSVEDIRTKMSVKDVSLEGNALAVMSNSMSGEDLAKVQKDGFDISDMTPEETVTNLDKIKATLAMSGVDIPGYTDDIPKEAIEKIAGSEGYAAVIESSLRENMLPITKENVEEISDVLKLSENVSAPTDDAKKYMINNALEPTVNNFYMANHSSAESESTSKARYYKDETGYVGKNSVEADFNELRPQVEKIIVESGYEVSEETLTQAKWLIDKNVPLSKENLEALQDINSVVFPLESQIVAKSAAAAIADGFKATDASLTNTESISIKAGKAFAKAESELNKKEAEIALSGNQNISERRLLEETRLHLTLQASISLLKKGIEIDTSDLQKLVEDLKQAEKETYAPFLMKEKYEEVPEDRIPEFDKELELKIDLFRSTVTAVKDIENAPLELISRISSHISAEYGISDVSSDNSLADISREARELKSEYEKAGKAYETLMTAPRADMGDSIKKAFRNVDDILEDMNKEVNRLNEKAVRILGYSGMEINDKNIENAVKAEVAVENLISNMTPSKVLKMIRDGENPLDEDIFELSERIAKEDVEKDSAKYSEFLCKLEKSGGITESEKSAFIGMYRLFRKIEKSDGKLVGDVLKADEKMTLSNIISASRSDRQVGTDIKIDDSFGALEKLVTYGESITDQILKGFSGKDLNIEYAKEEAESVKDMLTKEEAVLKVLENVNEPETPINMAAVDALINTRGSLYKGLGKFAKETEDKDKLKEDILELQDSFDDEESTKKAFEIFIKKASETVKNEAENADNYIDLKSLKLINKQLTIVGDLANESTYEVPVEINGELTSISLKIISDSENAGKINVSFETEEMGKVSSEFTLRNGEVSGFVVTENSYYEGVVKETEKDYRNEFEKAGVKVSSMYYTSSKSLSIKGNYTETVGEKTPGTKQLYNVAKAIIKAVQK